MPAASARATVTISSDLIYHVRDLFVRAAVKIVADQGTDVQPHETELALPAYIIATTAVEAFVNEMILSDFASLTFGEMGFEGISESLERLDLIPKLVLLPRIAFGKVLAADRQPIQDMAMLCRLRNEIVHYKMSAKPPKAVGDLAQRGIAIPIPGGKAEGEGSVLPWPVRISTLEGIQWAHNTACLTMRALTETMPATPLVSRLLSWNFPIITDEERRTLLEKRADE